MVICKISLQQESNRQFLKHVMPIVVCKKNSDTMFKHFYDNMICSRG